MNKFHEMIKKIGEELDINVTLLSDDWTTILEKNNEKHYITGYTFDSNSHALGNIIDDKGLFYDLLKSLNIPVIEQYVIFHDYNKDEVINYFKKNNNELVIKGNIGNSGREVFKVDNEKDLFNIIDEQLIKQYSVSLCPYYHIKNEYRIVVLDNEVKVFFGKIKPMVIGDGKKKVRELAKEYNSYYLSHEDEIINPDYLPKDGETVEINFKFNLISGGKTFINIEPNLKNKIIELAIKVTKEVGITFCSVDIINTCDDELLVMEANSGVKMDNFIKQNVSREEIAYNIYKEAIKLMFKLDK